MTESGAKPKFQDKVSQLSHEIHDLAHNVFHGFEIKIEELGWMISCVEDYKENL